MSADSQKKIRVAMPPRGRAAALATPVPTRRFQPLVKPAAKPQPTKPRFLRPPDVKQASVMDAAPQAAASQAIQPADSAAESTRSSAEKAFGAAQGQVEKADQMAARTAAERQTLIAQNFAAYVHASTTAVRGMQQLGQLWVAFLQASIRQSATAAFGWTKRR